MKRIIINTTRQTIARWKTEDNKLALVLTHKYLDDRKINEFITTGKIEKFEEMNNKYESDKSKYRKCNS